MRSTRARAVASVVLLVLGTIVGLAAVTFVYAEAHVLSRKGFSDGVVAAVRHPEVRRLVADELAQSVVAARPNLVAAQAGIEAAVRELTASEAFRPVVRGAGDELYSAIFVTGVDHLALDVADGGLLIQDYLARSDPRLAAGVPPRLEQGLLEISERTWAVRTVEAAHTVRVLAWVLPLLALALLVAAVAVAPSRRRAAFRAGIVVAAVGVVFWVSTLVVIRAVGDAFAHEIGAGAARAIAEAFLGDALRWMIVLGVAGGLVAAAASGRVESDEAERVTRRAWLLVSRQPTSGWGRAVHALALVAIGLLALVAPLLVLQVLAAGIGVLLVLDGLTELIRLVARPGEARVGAAPSHRRLWGVLGVAGVVAAGVLAVGAGLALRSAHAAPELAGRCNGHAALCDRRLDQVVFPATHNSMSSANAGFTDPNHRRTIRQQLDSGIRALLIDDHSARPTTRTGIASTRLDAKTRASAIREVGVDGLADAERLIQATVAKPTGPYQPYLCHIVCELGATRMVDAMRGIRTWLDEHPEEVLILDIQDLIPVPVVEQLFRNAGLLHLVYRAIPGSPLPTLGSMIRSNKRVLVMGETLGTPRSWYAPGYRTLLKETPYANGTIAALRSPASCRPNRGKESNPLFLLNHWVATYPPKPTHAQVVNRREFLLRRARLCQRLRGALPNIVAVDFASIGDVVAVADALNGL